MSKIVDTSKQTPCPEHPDNPVIWECDTCGKKMCKDCTAVGFKYKEYCADCSEKIDTVPQQTVITYVGFLKRLGAVMVDAIVLVVINLILLILPTFLFSAPLFVGYAIISFVLLLAYLIGFTTMAGQTPGKMAMEIKVVNNNIKNPSFLSSFLRYIFVFTVCFFYVLGIIMFYMGLKSEMGTEHLTSITEFLKEYHRYGISGGMKGFYVFLLALIAADATLVGFTSKKKALHDVLSGTSVIRDL